MIPTYDNWRRILVGRSMEREVEAAHEWPMGIEISTQPMANVSQLAFFFLSGRVSVSLTWPSTSPLLTRPHSPHPAEPNSLNTIVQGTCLSTLHPPHLALGASDDALARWQQKLNLQDAIEETVRTQCTTEPHPIDLYKCSFQLVVGR